MSCILRMKLNGHVGTRFIASTSVHIEPWPGRDKSRPYMLPIQIKIGGPVTFESHSTHLQHTPT